MRIGSTTWKLRPGDGTPMKMLMVLLLSSAFIASMAQPVLAAHQSGHDTPQGPAKITFAPDFPSLADSEWGFAMGGFGGVAAGSQLSRVPVIFVHGNNVDACDWYPVRDAFEAAGWSLQEMYGLSYNGLGANNGNGLIYPNPECNAEHSEMGWDGSARVTGNDVNVGDLHSFILAVRTYTGSEKFSIVSHSLGVTLARKTLKVHSGLRTDLVAFVGIAGANHGTSFCPPGSEGNVMSCDEIAAGTAWLDELNGAGGSDETYSPAKWLTIYDGSGGGDPAFAGPTYAQSPRLEGADNREFPGTYHNDLRLSPSIIDEYRLFLESASVLPSTASTEDAGRGSLAPTGHSSWVLAGTVLLVLGTLGLLSPKLDRATALLRPARSLPWSSRRAAPSCRICRHLSLELHR